MLPFDFNRNYTKLALAKHTKLISFNENTIEERKNLVSLHQNNIGTAESSLANAK